jgi:hypothetical protein
MLKMYESLYSSFISPFITVREFMVKMMRTSEAISKNPYNPRSNFGKLCMLLLDRNLTTNLQNQCSLSGEKASKS